MAHVSVTEGEQFNQSQCSLLLLLWLQNSLIKGVYPASPSSWLFVVIAILATMYMRSDPSMGLITKIQQHLPLRYTENTQMTSVFSFLDRQYSCSFLFCILNNFFYQLLCLQQHLGRSWAKLLKCLLMSANCSYISLFIGNKKLQFVH